MKNLGKNQESDWIYSTLNNVSRSFSFVIKELPIEIRDCVAIFYLILRGLDTIEDDMKLDTTYKIKCLEIFTEGLISKEKRKLFNHGRGVENKLMLEFDNVYNIFDKLPNVYRNIITEITQNMSHGMIKIY
jgi:farnesyl-diphosphate farnesyltransferase